MRIILNKLSIIIFSFIIFVLCINKVYAINYPNPVGYVNDFANIFSADFKGKLETQLSDFQKQTGTEFSIVTIKSLEGMAASDYANRLFEKWKKIFTNSNAHVFNNFVPG